jgi:hypothetical protein
MWGKPLHFQSFLGVTRSFHLIRYALLVSVLGSALLFVNSQYRAVQSDVYPDILHLGTFLT